MSAGFCNASTPLERVSISMQASKQDDGSMGDPSSCWALCRSFVSDSFNVTSHSFNFLHLSPGKPVELFSVFSPGVPSLFGLDQPFEVYCLTGPANKRVQLGQWPKHCRGLARRLGANLFDYLNTLCFFIFHVKLVCVKSRSFHVFLAGASQSGIALFGRGWTRVRHITVQVLENLQSWEIASCKHISPWGLLQRWHLPSTQGI